MIIVIYECAANTCLLSNEISSYSTLIAVQNAIKLSFLRRDVNISACHVKVISVLDLIDVLSQGRFWICFHSDRSMILYSRCVLIFSFQVANVLF